MRSALPAFLLAAVLVTAGCASVLGPSHPPSDPRATAAVDRAAAATDGLASYRFTVDGDVRASEGDESLRVDVIGDGVVDVADRRMHVTTESDGETRETYVSETAAYTECPRFGWGHETLSSSTRWLNHTPVGHQLALLQRTDVYWRGNATVDGTGAVVVEAYPTAEELRSVAVAHGSDVADLEDANVQNVTVTVWFSRETDRPLKVERYVRVERGGATAEATVAFRFHGYGDPVNVTRPDFGDDVVRDLGC
jgi:hypothetical protein